MKRSSVLMVVLLAAFVAACGVPVDNEPQAINENQVPYGLLAPSTVPQTVTTLPVIPTQQTVYMIRNDKLAAVTRTVASPPALGTVLAATIQGPTQSESASGLRGAINSEASVLSSQTTDGIASINLNDAFSGLNLNDQILALAQIVYTATEMPGVNSVRVMIDSSLSDVPRGDGSVTREPLSRSDYAQVAP